jgi:hypothetical protein
MSPESFQAGLQELMHRCNRRAPKDPVAVAQSPAAQAFNMEQVISMIASMIISAMN